MFGKNKRRTKWARKIQGNKLGSQCNGLESKHTQNHVNSNDFRWSLCFTTAMATATTTTSTVSSPLLCGQKVPCLLYAIVVSSRTMSEGVKTRSCMYSVNLSVCNVEWNMYVRLKSTRTPNKMWIISCQSSVEPIFFGWPWLKSVCVCVCAKRSCFSNFRFMYVCIFHRPFQ